MIILHINIWMTHYSEQTNMKTNGYFLFYFLYYYNRHREFLSEYTYMYSNIYNVCVHWYLSRAKINRNAM